MDAQAISTFVSSVGFPIACCAACFWYIYNTGQQHKEEMNKMAEAVNNNTIVMQKILTKLGLEED